MISWVTKRAAMQALGMTDGAIRSKISRKWQRGVHYAIIDGSTWINLEEVQLWITQQASDQCGADCRSAIPSMGSGTRKRSTSSRLGLV
jgi:hypothetical protein